MKKAIGIVIVLLALVILVYPFAIQLRTSYCCTCQVDGWRFGIGIKSLYERDRIMCSCAATAGCVPSYRILPIDFIAAFSVLGLAGTMILLSGRKKSTA